MGAFSILFRAQLSEEWRMHSTLFGGLEFALFPLFLLLISTAMSFFFSAFVLIVPLDSILVSISGFFALAGFSVGAFGLFGKEILNRRLGEASLVSYSSRILPLGEREILVSFAAKDIFYYSVLWLAPITFGVWGGVSLFSLVFGLGKFLSVPNPFALFSGCLVSFVLGISLSFFLSGIFVRSKVAFGATVGAIAIWAGAETETALAIVSLGGNFSILPALVVIAISAIFATGGIALLETEYPEERGGKNGGNGRGVFGNFSFEGIPNWAVLPAKELLDFFRNGGGIGRVVFALAIPLGAVLYFLFRLSWLVNELPVFLSFSVFCGVVASSAYGWLTEFDNPNSYSFLPLKKSSLARGKLYAYFLLQAFPIILLISAWLFFFRQFSLIQGIFALASFSAYALAITLRIAGLEQAIRLYSGANFAKYSLLVAVPAGGYIMSPAAFPHFSPLAIPAVLLLVSIPIAEKALEELDSEGFESRQV